MLAIDQRTRALEDINNRNGGGAAVVKWAIPTIMSVLALALTFYNAFKR